MEMSFKGSNQPVLKAKLSVLLMGLVLAIGLTKFTPWIAKGDLLGYWSSARLIITGGNPYDVKEVALIQAAQRPELVSDQGISYITAWNPPQLTLFLIPLGLLPYNVAVPVWVFINVICLGFSIVLCWEKSTHPFDGRGFLVIFAVCLVFIPTLLLIILEQITGMLLLFMVISIRLIDQKRDVLAGVALAMIIVKPHLFYFVVLLILIWSIRWRRWGILIGMIVTGVISMLVMWVILPGWLGDYLNLLRNLPYEDVPTGTLGYFINSTFKIAIFNYAGILLLPLIPTFIRLAEREGWSQVINIALPLSLPLSFYGFGVDQIVILPTLIELFAWVRKKEISRWITSIVVIGYILSQIGLFYLLVNKSKYYSDFWLPWFVLGLYLIAKRQKKLAGQPVPL